MTIVARIGLASLLLAYMGCRSGPRVVPMPGPLQAVDEAQPSQIEQGSADVLVLEDLGHVRFLDNGRPSAGYELTSTYRVRVLTPGGRRYASFSTYLAPWDELVEVSGRSYAPGQPNSIEVLTPEHVQFRAPNDRVVLLYRDARVMAAVIPGADVGDILEYRLTVRHHQVFSLTGWWFDSFNPVKLSQLTVDVPKGWKIGWAYWEGERRASFEPKVFPHDWGQRLLFGLRDLSPRRREPQSVRYRSRRIRLVVANGPGDPGEDTFADWAALGAWYRSLQVDKARISDSAWASIREALGSEPSPESLFTYVRDQIRYVALFDDRLGAFRPHPAEAVWKKRFGDCKDKATLLLTLLKRIGMKAYPVLVGLGDSVFFDESFASIGAFNHVVLALPRTHGGYTFLDPTDRESVFAQTPVPLEGQGALVVRPDSVDLIRIPSTRPEDHATLLTYTVKSSDRLQFEARLSGDASRGWVWLWMHDRESCERRLQRTFLSSFGRAELESFEVKSGSGEVRVSATVNVDLLERRGPSVRVFPLWPYLHRPLLRDPVESRTSGVRIPGPGVFEVRVRFPKYPEIVALPEPSSVDNGAVAYRLQVTDGPDAIEIRGHLRIASDRVPKTDLSLLRTVDEHLRRASRSALVTRRASQ